ncbi:MAG TPA: YMGG-like glycine zipper-containing protein [Acetobacteraceae bacterium]
MRALVGTAAVLALAATLGGCAYPPPYGYGYGYGYDPYYPAQNTAAGALVGAGTGAAIGGIAGGGEGAAIGALAGGALGAVAGSSAAPSCYGPPLGTTRRPRTTRRRSIPATATELSLNLLSSAVNRSRGGGVCD